MGPGEVLGGAWVGHHELDRGRCIERQAQVEVVDAGGLDADTHGGTASGESLDEVAMTGAVVAEGPVPDGAPASVDGHSEFSCTDVDAHESELLHGGSLVVGCHPGPPTLHRCLPVL